jgi:hypothetical protein
MAVVAAAVLIVAGCVAVLGISGVGYGVAVDAGSEVEAVEAGSDADGNASPSPGIFCGGWTCDPRSTVCCISGTAGCIANGADASCNFTLACDDGVDCAAAGQPDHVCCAIHNGTYVIRPITCQPLSDCQKLPSNHVALCDTRDTPPCPNDAACVPIASVVTLKDLPGYYVCEGPEGGAL